MASALHEVLVSMSAGVQASEGLSGAGGAAFTTAHGRQEASVPYQGGFLIGLPMCSYGMTNGFSQGK